MYSCDDRPQKEKETSEYGTGRRASAAIDTRTALAGHSSQSCKVIKIVHRSSSTDKSWARGLPQLVTYLHPSMHPLTRQRTPDSVLSWWSDSNPTGPNINLHAAAKPLMRFLYHKEATDFVAKSRGTPLSSEDMEIYSSYLAYKYVSSDTKSILVRELQARVQSEKDGSTVADSLAMYLIDELLQSPDAGIVTPTCWMLGQLARHKATLGAVLLVKPCQQLVSLLQCVAGTMLDRRITRRRAGCRRRRNHSGNGRLRSWRSWHATNPRRRQSWYNCYPCCATRFEDGHVTCWERCDEDVGVVGSAAKGLCRISRSPDGARAVIDAKVLESLFSLLNSSSNEVLKWTCDMLGEMARHETTARVVVAHLISLLQRVLLFSPSLGVEFYLVMKMSESSGMRPGHCVGSPDRRKAHTLSSMANCESVTVIENAAKSLCQIARSSDGTQALIDGKVLECLFSLLNSSSDEVQKWTCDMLGEMARHQATAREVMAHLVSLLRPVLLFSPSLGPELKAAKTLCRIVSLRPDGARALIDGKVLECLFSLLNSSSDDVVEWTCDMLGETEHHKTTAGEVVAYLVSLLRRVPLFSLSLGPEFYLVPVMKVSESLPGMQRAHCVRSPDHRTVHGFSSMANDENVRVIGNAARALCRIAGSPDGAQAVINAKVLEFVPQLVNSLSDEVVRWTCGMLGEMAYHDSELIANLREVMAQLSRRECGQGIVFDRRIAERHTGSYRCQSARFCAPTGQLVERRGPEMDMWHAGRDSTPRLGTHGEGGCGTRSTPLAASLNGQNHRVSEAAARTLYRIAISPDGAKIVLNDNAVTSVPQLRDLHRSSPHEAAHVAKCNLTELTLNRIMCTGDGAENMFTT
ncbi:armadillo-type protein [Mycena pura]|uniref:Armadillo-type protein n=1 Tax=Mycena pura TaxID=153505 RepID=A0AAD6XZA0_9AGAR|nr:armadillo-type protein [Mycena pura]